MIESRLAKHSYPKFGHMVSSVDSKTLSKIQSLNKQTYFVWIYRKQANRLRIKLCSRGGNDVWVSIQRNAVLKRVDFAPCAIVLQRWERFLSVSNIKNDSLRTSEPNTYKSMFPIFLCCKKRSRRGNDIPPYLNSNCRERLFLVEESRKH